MSDQLHFIRGGKALDPSEHVSMVECGCCECYHREDFWGDCRNDSQRFLPHDPIDGEPEYVCADGEHWITDAELSRREDARAGEADSQPLTPQDQGEST